MWSGSQEMKARTFPANTAPIQNEANMPTAYHNYSNHECGIFEHELWYSFYIFVCVKEAHIIECQLQVPLWIICPFTI